MLRKSGNKTLLATFIQKSRRNLANMVLARLTGLYCTLRRAAEGCTVYNLADQTFVTCQDPDVRPKHQPFRLL
jgi:hypothetical protein